MGIVGKSLVGTAVGCLVSCVAVGTVASLHAGEPQQHVVTWLHDYGEATAQAKEQQKYLLVYFHGSNADDQSARFEQTTLCDEAVAEKLAEYVCLKLPLDAKVRTADSEEPIVLLHHQAFRHMEGLPGLAMIDYAHPDAEYYGHVVSCFPFLDGRAYGVREVQTMLGLPPGTITQRTLIYAVRIHPDKPASTDGQLDPYLTKEATMHAEYQARIGVQGHHNWETRFHRINARLPNGLLACEVCAESWPGEGLLEAAIECVRCWRLSSGHWEAVRLRHPLYGYDMKRGSNGVWYATGIFARRPPF